MSCFLILKSLIRPRSKTTPPTTAQRFSYFCTLATLDAFLLPSSCLLTTTQPRASSQPQQLIMSDNVTDAGREDWMNLVNWDDDLSFVDQSR